MPITYDVDYDGLIEDDSIWLDDSATDEETKESVKKSVMKYV